MGDRVALCRALSVGVSVVLLSGCGGLSDSRSDGATATETPHTIAESCAFPKSFFATHLGLNDLVAAPMFLRPDAENPGPIGTGKTCGYRSGDSTHVGSITLEFPLAPAEQSSAASQPARILTVDGIRVSEVSEQPPEYEQTRTARVRLSATVDGWHGEFSFIGGDEQAVQAGAETLVDMIRALKPA